MRAHLKRLHSPDIEDLENFHPECADNFGFLLQAMIGLVGEEGEESFDIEVCTPKWIEENLGEDGALIGNHYIFVRDYNYFDLVRIIEKFLLGCTGESWLEVAGKVSKIGLWEFDAYYKHEEN